MAHLTNNELKMMDALAGVVDYVMETSSMMEEDNIMLCKICKDSGIEITLENMFYTMAKKRSKTGDMFVDRTVTNLLFSIAYTVNKTFQV